MNPLTKRRWFVGAIAAWGSILLAGVVLVADRDHRPAAIRDVPADWPSGTRLLRSPDRATLLVFAHPHCPCTRATLRELEYVLSRSENLAAVHVLLCIPEGAPNDFGKTSLREQALAIPDVILSEHATSQEARLFGAETSGEILVYHPAGQLLFRGGITGSRGHEGANAGRDALLACLHDPSREFLTTPVFGCSLFDDGLGEDARDSRAGMPPP